MTVRLRLEEDTPGYDRDQASFLVELAPKGNEAAMAFTIKYDAAKLRSPAVTLSQHAFPGTILTVNDMVPGVLTILIDSDQLLAPALTPTELVKITFGKEQPVSSDSISDLTFNPGSVNISDGFGGSIYSFQDKRTGTNDIYVHRISGNGFSLNVNELNIADDVQCFPNPFENKFELKFNLSKDEKISVLVYNVSGQFIAEPVKDKYVSRGNNSLTINTEEYQMAEGVYFLELKGTDINKRIKLIKVK